MSVGNMKRLGRTPSRFSTIVRIALVAVCAGIAAPVVLMTLQRVAVMRTRAVHPAPGKLVSVDGYHAHLNCLGTAEPGGPTVVLEAGQAGFSLDWVGIHVNLAERYRVCAYDRAGLGWSDARPGARDANHTSAELLSLLVAAGETRPVVLVGHGIGGVYALHFATVFPNDVCGLVLVDPLTDAVNGEPYKQQQRRQLSAYETTRFMVGSGLSRLLQPALGERALPPAARVLPRDLQLAYAAFLVDLRTYDTAASELQHVQTSVNQFTEALDDEQLLGDLPLVVLTAAHAVQPAKGLRPASLVPADPQAVAEQGALARLSAAGERRMLGRSTHLVQLEEPDAIIGAVDDVYASATIGTRLR